MKRIISLLLLLAFIPLAQALSATPANTNFFDENQRSYSGQFKIVTDKQIALSYDGELMDYIEATLNQDTVDFEFFPPLDLDPGTHSVQIHITEQPSEDATVVAQTAVHHTINFIVPYPDDYLESELLIDNAHPHVIRFTTVMNNLGSNLLYVDNHVDIFRSKEKIATLYKADIPIQPIDVILGYSIPGTTEDRILGRDRLTFTLDSGENIENQLTLNKLDLRDGFYRVESHAVYDDEDIVKEGSFVIGGKTIQIQENFGRVYSDRINKLKFLVISNWNEELSDLTLAATFSNGEISSSASSKSFDLRPERVEDVTIYWDARNLEAGPYTVEVHTYHQNKTFTETFALNLEPKTINITRYLVIAVLVLLLIVTIIRIRINRRRKLFRQLMEIRRHRQSLHDKYEEIKRKRKI